LVGYYPGIVLLSLHRGKRHSHPNGRHERRVNPAGETAPLPPAARLRHCCTGVNSYNPGCGSGTDFRSDCRPTQESASAPRQVGPQLADFPAGINSLTGLPVTDPALLNLPAIMISIPNSR